MKFYEVGELSSFTYNLRYDQNRKEYSFTWRESREEGENRGMTFAFDRREAEEFFVAWSKMLEGHEENTPSKRGK